MSDKFESWAIVELFGHQKIAGRVAEQQIAGTVMLRVDVPEAEGQAGFTRFYGGSAVYSITLTDEATARAAVDVLRARPITVYGVVAPERQIEARLENGEDYTYDFHDADEDEYAGEDEDPDYDWEADVDGLERNDREKAIRKAREILGKGPIFLDTETTGLTDSDQVVEVAVIDTDGSPLLVSLVKPTIPVSPGARSVHGIGDEELADAPGFDEVLPELRRVLSGRVVVVYNLAYDWQILTASARAHDLDLCEAMPAESACAMELYAQFWGDWHEYYGNYRWQRLGDAAEQQDITLPEGMALHTARADAELTRRIVIAMAMAELPDDDVLNDDVEVPDKTLH